MDDALGGGCVRLANHTQCCDGPWLVVYRGDPPEGSTVVPARWVSINESGVESVTFKVAYNTLVPCKVEVSAQGRTKTFLDDRAARKSKNEVAKGSSSSSSSVKAKPPLGHRPRSDVPRAMGVVVMAEGAAADSSTGGFKSELCPDIIAYESTASYSSARDHHHHSGRPIHAVTARHAHSVPQQAVVLAACGGGFGANTEPGAPLSLDEVTRQLLAAYTRAEALLEASLEASPASVRGRRRRSSCPTATDCHRLPPTATDCH